MLKVLPAVVEVPHEILVVYDFPEDDSVPVIRAMQADYPNLFGVQNTLGPTKSLLCWPSSRC